LFGGKVNMEQPLVSVVIPFYSGINWLKDALTSVQNQKYSNIEVLVINDGSIERIDGITNLYDLTITIINKENGGPASARNLGIEKSLGKYIAFLDSDDLWMPDKLLKQINFMELNKSIWSQHSYEMFWGNSDKTKKINTDIYNGNVYRDCYISFKIQTSCVVTLRKILVENNIYFPVEKRYGQDGAFYKQIAKNFPIDYVDGVLSKFRIRGSNAGFRAKVQIHDRATTWQEIKDDVNIIKMLPKPIILAYRMVSIFSGFISRLNEKYVKSEREIEFFSKIVYIFPYFIFKLYSKKLN